MHLAGMLIAAASAASYSLSRRVALQPRQSASLLHCGAAAGMQRRAGLVRMMALKTGIVGLPNVGKSTLFNALMEDSQAQAANFPFCTIEPNVGVVPVPDKRLAVLSDINKSAKTVPTSLSFVDIAGLVEGASKGEGLGNQFLANILNVVRARAASAALEHIGWRTHFSCLDSSLVIAQSHHKLCHIQQSRRSGCAMTCGQRCL